MTDTPILFVAVVVSFLALGSFVGVIILTLKLGAQAQEIQALKEKNGECEKSNARLQASFDTVSNILITYLKAEQDGWTTNPRKTVLADALDKLSKMPVTTTNITNVTGQAEQVAAGTGAQQEKGSAN